MRDLSEWAADRVYIHSDVHLGWWDRVRVLVKGELTIVSETDVQYAPGRCESVSRVQVPRWRWPWARRMELGYAEVEPVDGEIRA